MPKVIKPSNPFTNVCWVSVSTTFSGHKFWLHRQFSSAQFQNEEMMGDGFLRYRCRFVLNSKRLLSTSCNKQGQSAVASSIFFMVLFPMLFEVFCRINKGVEKIKQTLNNELKFTLIFINVCQVR